MIAQLGERQTEDLKVPGSIPGRGIFLFSFFLKELFTLSAESSDLEPFDGSIKIPSEMKPPLSKKFLPNQFTNVQVTTASRIISNSETIISI